MKESFRWLGAALVVLMIVVVSLVLPSCSARKEAEHREPDASRLAALRSALESGDIVVFAKDEASHELNNVKPRIYLRNDGTEALSDFAVLVFFSVENGKVPVLEDYWTPSSVPTLSFLDSNGNYQVRYDFTGQTLDPGEVLPSTDGNVVSLHFADWSPWDRSNDYSLSGLGSTFAETDKIVVVDANGNVVAGTPPGGAPGDDTVDDDTADDDVSDDTAGDDTSDDDASGDDDTTGDDTADDDDTAGDDTADDDDDTPDDDDPGPGTTRTFFIAVPDGLTRQQMTFSVSGGTLHLNDGVSVFGDGPQGFGNVAALNSGRFVRLGAFAEVGDAYSDGDMTLANHAHVYGDVQSSSTVSNQAGAVIDGEVFESTDLSEFETRRWEVFFPEVTEPPLDLPPTSEIELLPGAYPAISVKSNAVLGLRAGTYTMESLIVEPQAELRLNNSQGPILIYIKNDFIYRGEQVRLDIETPNVFFGVAGTNTIPIQAPWDGILVAPYAKVEFSSTFVGHRGSYFAKDVEAHQTTPFFHAPFEPAVLCDLDSECEGFCSCPQGGECGESAECDEGLTCSEGGVCGCVPSCDGKQCGEDPSDGCGGVCGDYCPPGGVGCVTDIECAGGTVCLDGSCHDPSCATSACDPALCGTLCDECVPECGGLQCGVDPRCGTSCGSCEDGASCVEGMCAAGEPERPEIPAHPGPTSGASEVGTLPGRFSISAQARPNYVVPFDVPVGRGGVQPELGLVYTGNTSAGLVGAGWSLLGESAVRRCEKSIAIDGWQTKPRGTTSDAVCLDGQRLILVSGQPFQDGAKYRTEMDSFLDVTYRDVGRDGQWEVRSKDGTLSVYGSSALGYVSSPPGSPPVVHTWSLSEAVNRAGVSTRYLYTCRGELATESGRVGIGGTGGTLCLANPQLSTIEYGAKEGSTKLLGELALHRIRLSYELRDQRYVGRNATGIANNLIDRLATVSMEFGGKAVRRYKLGYVGLQGRLDFLKSVTECADEPNGEEVCLSPTTFEYAGVGSPSNFFDSTFVEQSYPLPSTFGGGPVEKDEDQIKAQNAAKPTILLDFNGDGKLDFLHPDADGNWQLTVARMVGNTLFEGPFAVDDDFRCLSSAAVGDFNGDGLSDLVDGCLDEFDRANYWLSTGNPQDPFLRGGSVEGNQELHGNATAFALDVDGDQVSEILTCGAGVVPNLLHKLSGVHTGVHQLPAPPQQTTPALCQWGVPRQNEAPRPLLLDLTGDKVANLVVPPFRGIGTGQALQFDGTTGVLSMSWVPTRFSGNAMTNHFSFQAVPYRAMDFNGDGLQELLEHVITTAAGVRVPHREVERHNPSSLRFGAFLWLNQGALDLQANQANLPLLPGDVTTSGISNEVFDRARVVDLDRDGRDELISFLGEETEHHWFVLRAVNPGVAPTGTVQFEASPLPGLTREARFVEDGMQPIVADVTGDGATDVLFHDGSSFRLHRGVEPERFLLETIEDGLGNKIRVTYDASGLNYTPAETCDEQTRCLPVIGPTVLVFQSEDNDGTVSGLTATHFNDARIGKFGRGPLGFRRRTFFEFDPSGALLRTVTEEYDNGQNFDEENLRYPRAGLLQRLTTETAEVENGLSEGGNPVPLTSFKTVVEHTYFELTSDAGRPFVARNNTTTTQSQMLDGTEHVLSRSFVVRGALGGFIDQYGNYLVQQTSTVDGDGNQVETSTVRNEFYPRGQRNENNPGDPSRWEVGLLRHRTTTSRGKTRAVSFQYDEDTGLLSQQVRAPDDPALRLESELDYDEFGNVVLSQVQSASVVKQSAFEYDAFGMRLVSITGPTGLQALVALDPVTGRVLTEVDPNGSATQHRYDAFGRKTSILTPTSMTESVVRASAEPGAVYQVEQVTTDGSATTRSIGDFDSRGQLLVSRSTGLDGTMLEQRRGYTATGLLRVEEQPHPVGEAAPGTTIYAYDRLGSVRAVATPGDEGSPSSVEQFEYATRYTAPAGTLPTALSGQAITFAARKIAADGTVETTFTGALQQALVRRQGTGPEAQETKLDYGAFGDITQYAAASNVLSITHDDWGRALSVFDSDIGTLSYEYDALDRLEQATDADGTITHYQYDNLDRLLRVTHPDSEERFVFDRDFEAEAQGEAPTQNSQGRLVRTVRDTPGGTFAEVFRYQPSSGNPLTNRGLLSSIQLVTDSEQFETSYEYYPGSSRVEVQHYPDGQDGDRFAVRYCYDNVGSVTHVFRASDPVNCNDPDSSSASPFWHRSSTFQGLVEDAVELGNGVSAHLDLDPDSYRLRGQVVSTNGGNLGLAYTYAPDGRLASEQRSGIDVQFDHEYDYQDSGVLGSVVDRTDNTSLYAPTYNSAMQLESGPSGLGTFSYEGAEDSPLGNRLQRVDPPPEDPTQAPHLFEYDGRGNQNLRQGPQIPGGQQTLTYNNFNLPERITTGTGATAFDVTFDYSATAQRIHTQRPTVEQWHFGGIYETQHLANDPNIQEQHHYWVYVRGQRLAEVTRTLAPGNSTYTETTQYFHYDRLGSVIALTDAQGNITAELDYDIYGNPKQQQPTPFGYTGYRHEQDLALADANGRFYDPQFGVFLSPDPVSPLGGSSPRMNRYAYVGYDPVNFTDPSGYFVVPLLFNMQALGTLATIAGTIGSINFLSTGEFKLTWDENTTEGAVTLLVATAAGAGCGVAGGPILAGLCAGFAGGATAASFAPRPEFGSILTGAVAGTIIGGVGSAVGLAAGAGALSLTQSHLAMTFASAAASSGTGVGIQLALGSEVNWTIVAAQGVISGALAFHRAAELDAAAMQLGQAAGRAAGSVSRSTAGITRSLSEARVAIFQTEFARVAGSNTQGTVAQILTGNFGGREFRIGVDSNLNVVAISFELTGPQAAQIGKIYILPNTFVGIQLAGDGIEVGVGPLPVTIVDAGLNSIDVRISSIVFSGNGNVIFTDASAPLLPIPDSLVQNRVANFIGNQAPLVQQARALLSLNLRDLVVFLEGAIGSKTTQ